MMNHIVPFLPLHSEIVLGEGITIHRLEKIGKLVASYGDITFHCISLGHISSEKFHAVKRNVDNFSNIGLLPLSRIKTKESEIIIFKRGLKIDNLENNDIFTIGTLLRKLHSTIICSNNNIVLENRLLNRGKYDPERIWSSLFVDPILSMARDLFGDIENLRQDLLRECLHRKKMLFSRACLIHGDVKIDNIIYSEDGVRLIDWEDSRLDHPLIDVAQIIFSENLGEDQIEILKKGYGAECFEPILRYFIFLNVIWTALFMRDYPNLRISAAKWSHRYKYPSSIQNWLADDI